MTSLGCEFKIVSLVVIISLCEKLSNFELDYHLFIFLKFLIFFLVMCIKLSGFYHSAVKIQEGLKDRATDQNQIYEKIENGTAVVRSIKQSYC